ncbi:hypothetical protein ES708_16656 [subsurface metagenome]
MAKLILSDIISDIRGTVGTHTYSYWKGTHLVKNRSVNYRTAHESAAASPYHSFIARVSQRWYGALDQAQRDGWDAYADYIATLGFPYYGSNVIKLTGWRQYGGTMSGFNAFVLTNMLRWSIGKTTILDDDPILIDPPPKPSFQSLEFILGPPKVLRVTIANPEALTEATWLRIFCRGHKMAHLQIAKAVQVSVGAAVVWDETYDCTVEPDAAVPAWTLLGNDFCTAAAGIITIDTVTPGGNSLCAYRLDIAGFDNAVGWMVEFKMKVNSAQGIGEGLWFWINDGTSGKLFYLSETRIQVDGVGGGFDMDTTDDFHVYRITGKGGVVSVFVDGILRITGTLSAVVAQKRISFGDFDVANGWNSDTEWEYIRWYLSGDTAPDEESHDFDELRYAKGHQLSLQNDLYDLQLDYISQSGRYSSPSDILFKQVRDGFPGGLWGSWHWDNYVWG